MIELQVSLRQCQINKQSTLSDFEQLNNNYKKFHGHIERAITNAGGSEEIVVKIPYQDRYLHPKETPVEKFFRVVILVDDGKYYLADTTKDLLPALIHSTLKEVS